MHKISQTHIARTRYSEIIISIKNICSIKLANSTKIEQKLTIVKNFELLVIILVDSGSLLFFHQAPQVEEWS